MKIKWSLNLAFSLVCICIAMMFTTLGIGFAFLSEESLLATSLVNTGLTFLLMSTSFLLNEALR